MWCFIFLFGGSFYYPLRHECDLGNALLLSFLWMFPGKKLVIWYSVQRENLIFN